MKLTVTIPNAVIVWNHNTGRMIVRNVAAGDRATFGDLAAVQAELGLEPEDPSWVHIQNCKLEVDA
jgi:hypothetical protein